MLRTVPWCASSWGSSSRVSACGRDDVGEQGVVEDLGGQVGDLGHGAGAEGARVVDEQVGAAAGLGGVREGLPVGGVRDVACDGVRRARPDRGSQGFGVAGVDDEVPAAFGEGVGQGGAEAAGGSGDDGDRHGVLSLLRCVSARVQLEVHLRSSRVLGCSGSSLGWSQGRASLSEGVSRRGSVRQDVGHRRPADWARCELSNPHRRLVARLFAKLVSSTGTRCFRRPRDPARFAVRGGPGCVAHCSCGSEARAGRETL